MNVSIIAAVGPNRELGKDNKLLWHISEDLKRFKKLTQGHAVIMGRKTYESLGKPLPDRLNVVITRQKNLIGSVTHELSSRGEARSATSSGPSASRRHPSHFVPPIKFSLVTAISLEEAIDFVKNHKSNFLNLKSKDEVFVIGGGQIYTQALPLADKLYLTLVEKTPECPDGKFDADTFFPEYKKLFTKKIFEEHHEENGYKYTFVELVK